MGIKSIIDNIKRSKLRKGSMPRHIAISVRGCREYAGQHNITLAEAFKKEFANIRETVEACIKLSMPMLSFYILPLDYEEDEIPFIIDALAEFFSWLQNWEFVRENQIKVSVLGKWYELPDRIIGPVKKILADTKDYDRYFLNFCINYDGQEEIADSIRLIARLIILNKVDPERITRELVKENLSSSYLLPPDIIIKTGASRKLTGFLLWDSVHSSIYFPGVLWPDFKKDDLLKAIEWWQENP